MWIEKKMKEMIDKYGKIPNVFSPYDLIDLSHGICTTLTTINCGNYGARGGVLLNDNYTNGKDNKKKYKENKMNYNLVNFCEFDKYAVKSYCAIHDVDEGLNLGDITRVDIESLPTEGVDLITHGSPCFTADTLVLTGKGYKNIIDVKVGDKVLDHTNTYNTVVNKFNQGKKEIWEINAMGSDIIRTTSNHKFYARKMDRVWHNDVRRGVREFSEPKWIECKDLSKEYYLGIAINQNNIIPKWNGVEDNRKGHFNPIKTLDMYNKQLWYMVGRFLGDGWTKRRKERNNSLSSVVICCGKHKSNSFEKELEGFLNYTKIEDRTVYKYQFSNKEFAIFCEQFGHGAKNKFIPSFVFDMPTDLLKELLKGYFDSDGSVNSITGKVKITSISKQLIYGIAQLVAKVYHRPYSIYFCKRPNSHVIEGRTVNQNDTYSLVFNMNKQKQDHALYENGYLWVPINSIINTQEFEEVYDIEVENAHSFTANGVIAHNCQSFSVAGKQHGGEKGSGTRSSLLWNSVEIIRHCKPKFVIWENVKNVLSKKHKPVFDAYVDEMKNMGYNTYYQVLNAKNYGIPQNRERIYAISVREDIDNNQDYAGHITHNKYYDRNDMSLFPEPFDNGLRLRDFLEDEVNEKYYLKDEYVERFKKSQESSKYPFGNEYKVLGTTVGTGRGTNSRHWVYDVNDNISTLDATMYKQPKQVLERTNKLMQPGDISSSTLRTPFGGRTIDDNNSVIINPLKNKTKYGWHFEQNVYDSTGLMRTLKAGGGSGNIPKVIEKEEMTNERAADIMRNEQCCQDDATFIEAYEKAIEALETTTNSLFRIRKLTPKECYRLMGFSDEDFEKAKAVNSNSQLYKQAGNSIVVNVLEEIYKCLHNAYPNDFMSGMNVMSLFSGIGAFEKALERVDFENFTQPQSE